MVRIPTGREPTHPGEVLLTEFLEPLGLTQRALASGVQTPYQRINEIVRGKRGVTPGTALRLSGSWAHRQTSGCPCNSRGTSTTPSAARAPISRPSSRTSAPQPPEAARSLTTPASGPDLQAGTMRICERGAPRSQVGQ